ncbi:MAG: hypothetical protein ABII96_08475 [Candidatus Zixiibacteriota bacterium]
MEKTLSVGIKRGFSEEKLKKAKEPLVKRDNQGFFIYTVNENLKVYFEDFYTFLEGLERKCLDDLRKIKAKMDDCDCRCDETKAFYCARKIIVEAVLKNLYGYYGDDSTLGVIMSPWCFGTVVLEKVENYKERLSRGELLDVNLPEYPYLVLRYVDEIYRKTLVELFEFPPEAFSVKWQYTEPLKRYAKILSDITTNLKTILILMREDNTEILADGNGNLRGPY